MKNEVIYDALSLGWGVQSTGMAFLAGMDQIKRPDAVYFSDLKRESQEVYDYIGYATPKLKSLGVEVITVQPGDIYKDLFSYKDFQDSDLKAIMIPLWFANPDTGKPQPLGRKCTSDYKIEPIARQIRIDLGLSRLKRNSVRIWQGISVDEKKRVKSLMPDGMRINHYPFIDHYANITYPDEKWLYWTRQQIVDNVFKKLGLRIPPKSSCFFCPFHDIEYWYHIYLKYPEEWELSCQLDDFIRSYNTKKGTFKNGPFFLYKGLIPLREIDFEKEIAMKQQKSGGLFEGCDSGFCFM